MVKVSILGVAALGLALGGCERLESLFDELAQHGRPAQDASCAPDASGPPDASVDASSGSPDGSDGAVSVSDASVGGRDAGAAQCPFIGCASTQPPAQTTLTSVWIAPGSEVWTAGTHGVTGRRGKAGDWCWCVQPSGTQFNAVWGSADDDIWIVGDHGTALHWTGSAFAGEPADFAPEIQLKGVYGSSANDVWIVGGKGTIRHFDGTTWTAMDLDPTYSLNAVWSSDPASVWIVGSRPLPIPVAPGGGSDAIALHRTGTGDWTTDVVYTQGYGYAALSAIDGTSPTDIWVGGANQPAGAAASYGGAAHFDGISWAVPTISGDDDFFIHTVINGIAAGTPDAPHGAWLVGGVQAVRADGQGDWTKSDNPLLGGMGGIDSRGDTMFAVGNNLTVARWNGTDWVGDFGPVTASP